MLGLPHPLGPQEGPRRWWKGAEQGACGDRNQSQRGSVEMGGRNQDCLLLGAERCDTRRGVQRKGREVRKAVEIPGEGKGKDIHH